MEGLSRITGAPVPIKFNGRDLLLDPPTLKDFGTIEAHLLSKRPNLIILATEAADLLSETGRKKASALPPDDPQTPARRAEILSDYQAKADAILNKAVDRAARNNKISQQELSEWIDSPAGLAFLLWLKLSARYPGEFTLDGVWKIVEDLADEQIAKIIAVRDESAGLGLMGNSTGPSPAPQVKATAEGIAKPAAEKATTNAH